MSKQKALLIPTFDGVSKDNITMHLTQIDIPTLAKGEVLVQVTLRPVNPTGNCPADRWQFSRAAACSVEHDKPWGGCEQRCHLAQWQVLCWLCCTAACQLHTCPVCRHL